MAPFSVTLLGGFKGRLDDDPLFCCPPRKAWALLAFPGRPPGQAHRRDKLTALLRAGCCKALLATSEMAGRAVRDLHAGRQHPGGALANRLR